MTREEAIKIANEMYGWMKTDREREALMTLAPELAESEDERIRKAVVSLVYEMKGTYQSFAKVELDKMVAWLEKQKYDRMKPIYDARESFESALEKAWNDYHNGYENVDKLEDGYVECAHAKGFREGYLFGIEKQKEQKPAEWSEEDENKIERLAFLVSVAEEKEMISPSESVDLRNFIKSLRPSWKPSEELLEALHIAAYIREIEFYGGIKDKLRQLYENLKRL